jgi:hypothetical protein
MKFTILILSSLLFFTDGHCAINNYLFADFLTAKNAEKKWGTKKFEAISYKKSSDPDKAKMAVDLIKNKYLVGWTFTKLREQMGAPDSYFFSDTIYAYRIDEPVENKESWQLLFIPDDKLEKVAEIKINKFCCYKDPFR